MSTDADLKDAAADAVLQRDPNQKVNLWTRFRSFIWDSDTHLKSKEERHFLLKLDAAVLTMLCLGWFLKYLDQNNLNNAYISGMKEDLNIEGNEYTYMQTIYSVTYAVMQIPGTIIVSKVRPSYWIAMCELGWGIFTFAQAGAQSTHQMYAFRAMVGLFESSFFPCAIIMLGAWYTPVELAKRTAIFHLTANVGSAFAGYLQTAAYKNLNGTHGLEGWRWLYIICGVMTAPCFIAALFLLPDYPHNTRAFYLNQGDIDIANARSTKNKKAEIRGNFTVATLKKLVTKWQWPMFTLAYVFYGQSCQATGYYGIWLKSIGASVSKRNIYPTFGNYCNIVCLFLWGFLSDLFQSRFVWCAIPITWALVPLGILAAWPAGTIIKEFAFTVAGTHLVTAVMYSWANEALAGDPEIRALTIGSMNGLQYATNAWMTVVLFPQTDAPSFRKGLPATFAFAIVALFILTGIWLLQKRDARRAQRLAEGRIDEESTSAHDVGSLKDGLEKAGYQTGAAVLEARDEKKD